MELQVIKIGETEKLMHAFRMEGHNGTYFEAAITYERGGDIPMCRVAHLRYAHNVDKGGLFDLRFDPATAIDHYCATIKSYLILIAL